MGGGRTYDKGTVALNQFTRHWTNESKVEDHSFEAQEKRQNVQKLKNEISDLKEQKAKEIKASKSLYSNFVPGGVINEDLKKMEAIRDKKLKDINEKYDLQIQEKLDEIEKIENPKKNERQENDDKNKKAKKRY